MSALDFAKYGQLYSVALDAEAITRWLVEHRVNLVVHGHMHQPFIAEVSRPVTPATPGDHPRQLNYEHPPSRG